MIYNIIRIFFYIMCVGLRKVRDDQKIYKNKDLRKIGLVFDKLKFFVKGVFKVVVFVKKFLVFEL